MKKLIFCALIFPASIWAGDIQWGPVKSGDLVAHVRVPGKVIPKEGALSIESARTQGRITGIVKREGEAVHRGEPLFLINSPECLSLAEEKRVAMERQLGELSDAANSREQQLGLRVSDGSCAILATHDGTIVKRQVELGSSFNQGDALATILDINNLTIELDLPERDLSLARPGQTVTLQLASQPDAVYSGIIDRILPAIDPGTRTSKVRLSHMKLPKGITLDSLVLADVKVESEERILKVPSTALVFSRNRQYVVKQNGSNSTAVPVEVINETEKESSIRPWAKNTLNPKDQVVVKGSIYVFNKLQENKIEE